MNELSWCSRPRSAFSVISSLKSDLTADLLLQIETERNHICDLHEKGGTPESSKFLKPWFTDADVVRWVDRSFNAAGAIAEFICVRFGNGLRSIQSSDHKSNCNHQKPSVGNHEAFDVDRNLLAGEILVQ